MNEMRLYRIVSLIVIAFLSGKCSGTNAMSDPMQASYLLQVVDKLERGENIIFTKYGDGEYLCMIGSSGVNIDHDSYHPWLGNALQKALISLCQKSNTYIGRWHTSDVYNYCNQVARDNSVTIPWVWYHLFMNDDECFAYNYMYKFAE